ncbi:MAG: tyrosine-type recombinase/integrase, partial [Geminicoccaceae bacterium]
MAGDLTVSPALPSVYASSFPVPAQISSAGGAATERFIEFFIATIRNPHTRRAYHRAVTRFFAWCDQVGVEALGALRPLHLATYIEGLGHSHERATVKLHFAALRRLLDWLVTGGFLATNPATSVKGPSLVMTRGKTPVLAAEEVRHLLDSISLTQVEKLTKSIVPDLMGYRDRALIALM